MLLINTFGIPEGAFCHSVMKKDSGCGMSQNKNNLISGTIADGKNTNFGNSVKRTKSNSHCFADEVIKKTRQLMKQRTQINCIESSRRKISQRIFQLMSVMKVTLPCQSQKSQLARFIPIGERKTEVMLFPKGHTWLY